MSQFTKHDYMYSKMSLANRDNRDENIIIDVLGNWIPENELIYYGLLNSHYSEELYKLKNTMLFKPYDIYLDTCYFNGDDLIRYLASPDTSLAELSDDYLTEATNTALEHYLYVPCSETMLRHSIIELAYYEFTRSITLIYPWDVREMDYQYLKTIIPESVMSKFVITSGDMVGYIKNKVNSPNSYTTIISNSLKDINELIDNSKELKVDSSFFLLRNHSGNVKYTTSNNEKNIDFEELGNDIILPKLIDDKRMIPKSQMRFARYEPLLFEDAKPKSSDFMFGQ